MVVDVREYLKHRPTPEEIAAKVAWLRDWSRRLDEVNRESPMPEDIEDAVYGRPPRAKTQET
jgi:hypothetical protein